MGFVSNKIRSTEFVGPLTGTAETASIAISSSYAAAATTSSYALFALSASYEVNYETSSSYAETASLAILARSASLSETASYIETLHQDVAMTGSWEMIGNLTVNGTASFTYVTASQTLVEQNTITVFGSGSVLPQAGLIAADTASVYTSGSWLWDFPKQYWYTTASISASRFNGTASIADAISGSITQDLTISGSVRISGSLLINGEEPGFGAAVIISGSAPSGSTTGSMWFNNQDLNLYIQYNDGTSSYWLPSYNNQSLYANSASFAVTTSFANNFTVSRSFTAASSSTFLGTASFTSQTIVNDLQVINKIQHATSPKPSANYGVALGNNAMVSGGYGVAVGSNNFISASAVAAFVAGQFNTASAALQTIVGQYNAPNNTAGAFIVGGGTGTESGSRKNTAVFTTSSIILSSSIFISGSLLLNGAEVGGRGATVTITGSIPSGSANSGSLWWNENDGNLYIQVTGPTGSTYVPATNTVAGGNYGATLVTARTGSTWSINHNLNTTTPLITVYSGSSVMIPATIDSLDANNTRITFSGSVTGTAVLSTGIGNATANLAVSASYATTASLVVNATSASLATSASFATTASALLGTSPTYIQAYNASQMSLPAAATTTVAGWTSSIAQNATEWNPATGVFTATKAGTYLVSAKLLFNQFTPNAIGNELNISIVSSAQGTVATSYIFCETTSNVLRMIPAATAIVTVTPGQTILTNCYQATGAARTLFNNFGGSSITIQELPNKIQK